MKSLLVLRILLVAAAFLVSAAVSSAQTAAGAIKAAKVTGNVIKVSANGSESQLKTNDSLLETDSVRTSGNSSVVLVFANGSSVHLGETSRLAIAEFKMDPLAEDIAVAELRQEPSVSRTRLELSYGEMVGNVKTLSSASTYDIRTPVGAAGIRGTTYRIKLSFLPGGQVSFTLTTLEGRVAFTPTVPTVGGEATSTETVAVNGGDEVTGVATLNTTGAVTNIAVSNVTNISTEATSAIQAAVTQAIQQVQQSTTFTTQDQQDSATNTPAPGTNPAPNTTSDSQQEQQSGNSGSTTNAEGKTFTTIVESRSGGG